MHGNVVAWLGEPPVDPADVLLHGAAQLAVSRTSSLLGTAICRNASWCASRGCARAASPREQPLDDPLGVVEPVHAKQQRPAAELLLKRAMSLSPRGRGKPGELRGVDGNGRGDGRPRTGRQAVSPTIPAPQARSRGLAVQARRKLDPVLVGVEAHLVGAEQPPQDLLAPGQPGVDLRRRPRHVQEEPDRLLGTAILISCGTIIRW